MKKFIKTLVLAVMVGVSFTSCKKSEVEPETVEPVAPEKPKVEYIHIDLYTDKETAGVHYTLLLNKGLPSEKVITKIEDGECCVRGRDYVKVSFTAPDRIETIEVIQESPVQDINWGAKWYLSRVVFEQKNAYADKIPYGVTKWVRDTTM